MAKSAKRQAQAQIDTRVNRAVVGFQIPLMAIPPISKALRAAIEAGKTDEELKQVVGAFPGVTESM